MPTRSKQPQIISISTMTVVKIIAIILGLGLLWYLRDIIAIILSAILLAALIDPFATWLAGKKIPRTLAVIIVYIVLTGLTSVVVFSIIPIIIEQIIALVTNLSSEYGSVLESFERLQILSEEYGLGDNLNATLTSIQQGLTNSVSSLFSTVKGVMGGIAALFAILILAFYMVIEEDAAKKFFRSFLPEEYQPYFSQLFARMHAKIGAWLRGQLILGIIVGVAVYIGLMALGVPYALLLAVIAGLFEIVPYVGPVASVIPAAIIGFAASPLTGVFVLALYFFIQQLENNILVPKIMQKVTGLNPVVSIIALLVGIKIGGVVGAILSIPVATMGAVVLEDLFKEIR